MPYTFAACTLGCKVNQYETDAMGQMLEKAGFRQVDFKGVADIYLINTCSVTHIADKKSRQMIHRARRQNPQAVVVAAGCHVQAKAAQNVEFDRDIDLVVGNNKKKEIAALIEQYMEDREKKGEAGAKRPEAGKEEKEAGKKEGVGFRKAIIGEIGKDRQYEELSIDFAGGHTRAYLKVQDGCDQFCSYCIIPYVRGRVRSREACQAVREMERLSGSGCKEVVLTGIHLSSYGKETPGVSLIDLIEQAEQVRGIERIRLGSLEPRIITRDFVRRLTALKKICPHFHLSLQSGCDDTLKRMNRHYTIEEYKESLSLLREAFSEPALTTDVIVGFPGETEEEFARTKKALFEMDLYEMHIFKYSVREGTKAEHMGGQVAEQVKAQRSNELLAMAKEKKENYEKKWIGREEEILAEEIVDLDGRPCLVGHTKRYVKVGVLCGNDLTGQLVPVKITGHMPGNMLFGEIL